MKVTVDIDIKTAKNVLYIASGSYEEAENIINMNDEQIIDTVIKHCKCWGMARVKENNNAT